VSHDPSEIYDDLMLKKHEHFLLKTTLCCFVVVFFVETDAFSGFFDVYLNNVS